MSVDERLWQQVENLLDSGLKLALASTGGGSQVLGWLLNHPGASRAVLEGHIPYHAASLALFLERPGPHPVVAETARAMALRAWQRAARFAGGETDAVGVGCTAALRTRRERRGEDRACIALRTATEYHLCDLHFARGAASRLEQEDVTSQMVLSLLLERTGDTAAAEWPEWAVVQRRTLPVQSLLERLLQGEIPVVEDKGDGSYRAPQKTAARLLLSGSFNPLHAGHIELALAAQELTGREAHLEISVENVDKPELGYEEVLRRLAAIDSRFPMVVTRAPTFHTKARLFPNACFAIGFDTAVRLLDPKYYGDEENDLLRALEGMRNSCFLVAGRLHKGAYRTLEEIAVPPTLREMFAPIPESAFRQDISSTEIRKKGDPNLSEED